MFGRSTSALQRSFERLASGRRIVRASDDAAGLAISSELNLSSRVFTQAIRNANDTVSALNIAQGSLEQFGNVLIRMRELATQASQGTISHSQRQALDRENGQLFYEYNRILNTTTFNSRQLLTGEDRMLAVQLGFQSEVALNVNMGEGLERTVGNGSFSSGVGLTAGGSGIFSIDINGDGNLDLVEAPMADSRMFWQLGNGDGTFAAAVQLVLGSNITSAA